MNERDRRRNKEMGEKSLGEEELIEFNIFFISL
jgi:hypothetical protein